MISPVRFGGLRIDELKITEVAITHKLDDDYPNMVVDTAGIVFRASGMVDAMERAGLDVLVTASSVGNERHKGPVLCYQAVKKDSKETVGETYYSPLYQPAKGDAKPAATLKTALQSASAYYAMVFAQFIGGEAHPPEKQ